MPMRMDGPEKVATKKEILEQFVEWNWKGAVCGLTGPITKNDLRQILKMTKQFRFFENDDEGLQRHITP